ncbi:MAG TPA: DUF167 family protein [Beijerinckiaceae bacterium]|nr:DUF167 family protein [Beijerinckiaceae bacterium]
MTGTAWRPVHGGIEVRVRVTPRGGRDALDGVETLADDRPVLKIRVRAAPAEGAANEAVRRILAKALDRPASAVGLETGAAARVKTFSVAGDPAALGDKLARLAGAGVP